MNQYLDVDKSIESIIYIANRINDLFHIAKILYYADKFHLGNYGRQITGDYYRAMSEGPVPSGAYDLIKRARGDVQTYEARIVDAHPERSIQVRNNDEVIPLREPNLDYLSESDIECLDEAIKLYADMDGKKLWKIVHEEEAYKSTPHNGQMKLKAIILSLPTGKEVLDYLNS